MVVDKPLLSRDVAKRDLEEEYREFCTRARPITAVLISFASVIFVVVLIGAVQGRTHNYSLFQRHFVWLRDHGGEIIFFIPATFASVRGRKYLRGILLGTLSIRKMFLVGISIGCMTCYLSSISGDKYFFPPSFNVSGFLDEIKHGITSFLLAPFGEEMFYQVGLQTWLQRFGPIVAVVCATIPFWLSHFYGNSVPLTVAVVWLLPGMLANALVRQITKSSGAAMITHATYNVLVSILSLYPR